MGYSIKFNQINPMEIEEKEVLSIYYSLIITANHKVPFVWDYYFEIKIIKIGNFSVGLRRR